MPNNNPNKSHDVLIIAIFCLVCSLAWLGSKTYHGYTQKKKSLIPEELLKPLNPNLNTDIFIQLEKRQFRSDEEIKTILQKKQPTPTPPTPSPTAIPTSTPPTATESAQPTANPATATPTP